MLIEFIYTSDAKRDITATELNEIKLICMRNNAAKQITGMLLFDKTKFMQVLEGEKETVLTLFDKIKQDPRHTDIKALILNPIHQRNFGAWAMAVVDVSNEPMNEDFLSDPNLINKSLSKKLLLAFSHHLIEID